MGNERQKRYNATHIKRVHLDMQISLYEEIKACADEVGEPVNTYIKKAIKARLEYQKPNGDYDKATDEWGKPEI